MATRPRLSPAAARAADSLSLSDLHDLVSELHARQLHALGDRRFTEAPRLASSAGTPLYLHAPECDELLRVMNGLAATSRVLAQQMATAHEQGEEMAMPIQERVDLAEAVLSLAIQARDEMWRHACEAMSDTEERFQEIRNGGKGGAS